MFQHKIIVPHKVRLAVLFSGLVAIILLITSLITYLFYSSFRKEEFYDRLEEKALNTARLLIDVREIDNDILKIIDQNTINKLYEEKVLVFDPQNRLIYSSIDDHKVNYSPTLLQQIREQHRIEYTDKESEIIGLFYNEKGQNNVVIASAYDKYGRRKLNNLIYTLAIAGSLGMLLTGVAGYYYVQQTFKPVELLNEKIARINATNLQEKLTIENRDEEINRLAQNFNYMLDRLSLAFETQKNFVQHASHELRTPLATLVAQLEAARKKSRSVEEYQALLASLQEDLDKLTNITNSLLLLARYDQMRLEADAQRVRIDELVFEAVEDVKMHLPQAIVSVGFQEIPEDEALLTVQGQELMLKNSFVNLIENACKYSDNQSAQVLIHAQKDQILIQFFNEGSPLSDTETSRIFQPFFRGQNASGKRGFGLGLSMVRRIIEAHGGTISYQVSDNQINIFSLVLPH
ncbi:ATP-binding protein [Cytophagaceae bacterium YF14B1]|uniref:histidine kinase n=1 Tax=Xanthocytophaga flava TaxID=3048013 RepID=A0AAE3QRI3_9BACT|nr:ATP-binding protein [Xanthocytophaga flavus]MDJ1483990.1 ATP-binding protein [Xanthocytophaga flavus]